MDQYAVELTLRIETVERRLAVLEVALLNALSRTGEHAEEHTEGHTEGHTEEHEER